MPISIKLLRRRCRGPLNAVTYLDLSSHGLARIENLNVLPKLQTLNLRGNDINLVQNLAICHHLWHVDLANNRVTNLEGLSKFVAMGTLNLSLNNLSWSDLRHIRHMYILELSLHGNPKLDKDPYYRMHIIDCLPNVWMLDGRLVTSAERIQVQHFFQDTAVSNHPVRHKLPKDQFVPSTLKEIQVHGIYGSKTTHFMVRFPANGALNVTTDCRRLMYMAYNLEEDIQIEAQQTGRTVPDCKDFMEKILEVRNEDREKCNILLMLLVASLEFSIPPALLEETLVITKLKEIVNDFDCLELFMMPQDHRCRVLSLLLSAVKIDRDDHKDGGLYDKLYLCLYYTVAELIKHFNTGSQKNNNPIDRTNPIYREYRSLLAAEVVQLLCIVPSFYRHLTKDSSITQLVTQATGNASTMEGVEALMERIHNTGGGSHRMIEEVSEYLVECIHRNTKRVLHKKLSSKSTANYVLETPRALPKRPQSSPVFASNFMAVGQPSPVGKPYSRPNSSRPSSRQKTSRPNTASTVRSAPAMAAHDRIHFPKQQETWCPAKPPKLGDKVLLGPQSVAYIIALPEYDVALLQKESIPVPNGSVVSFSRNSEEHYAYMNMVHMEWDSRFRYWKPIGSIGDRITLQTVDNSSETKPPPSSPTSSISPRSVGESETETTHHPSPRDSSESLPQPISMRFREKLQLSPEKITAIEEEREELEEKMNRKIEEEEQEQKNQHQHEHYNRMGGEEDRLTLKGGGVDRPMMVVGKERGNLQDERNGDDRRSVKEGDENGMERRQSELSLVLPEEETTLTDILSARLTSDKKTVQSEETREETHEGHGGESLYNCLRCAMETIKINTDVASPPITPNGDRNQTERAVNASLVGQVAHANTASMERFANSSHKDSTQRQTHSRPNTARSAPDSARSQAEVKILDLNIWPTESGVYTDYQREKTKEWDRSVNRPKSSPSVRSKGSRASSAKTRASTPTQRRDSQGSPLLIQLGNHWLAGGRDLATWERIANRMKTLHSPGWLEGVNRNRQQRPKSSAGPYKYRPRGPATQRRVKSAVGPREKVYSYEDLSHPPPSPASTDFNLADRLDDEDDLESSYLTQAHRHNFTSPSRSPPPSSPPPPIRPSSATSTHHHALRAALNRPATPPFGSPKKPSSPLSMSVKFL